MEFFSWLRSRKRHESPRRRPSFKPTLDALEGRWVPSQIGLSVTSLADSGPDTLRAAILTADAGSPKDQFTIGFGVTGTIDLQSPLPDLNNTIAIQGPGASSLTVERAAGYSFSSAIVTVDAGQTVGLSGLTIANGNSGGISNTGTLTVSGCTISGNAADIGGGIYNTGTLTISNNSTLSGNSAANKGGAIFNFGGALGDISTLTISNSTLKGNVAGDAGGGIMNWSGTLTVSASAVSGNSAAVGGGVYNLFGLATIQQHSTLCGNSAADGGGIVNGGTLTVSGCTLAGNTATGFDFGGVHYAGRGGAIEDFRDGTVTTVRDCVFIGNSAELGGAIYSSASYGGMLDVRGSTFRLNSASDSGGAIFNNAGTATIQASTFSGNSAGSKGGGVFNAATGTLVVKDSTVLMNVAPLGADIYNLGALTLDDSTVGVIGP
jgi:predicted outer membrane repeat protein